MTTTQALSLAGGNPSSHAYHVLVVEDEPTMRKLACDWLQELGFRTSEAGSASEALELLQAQPFDVLFADILLPGTRDGFELAAAATSVQPRIKALFVSGSAWGPRQDFRHSTTFLHKPYSIEDLAGSMRLVLEE